MPPLPASATSAPRPGETSGPLGPRVARAIAGIRDYLFTQQHPDGYWCGELEADTMLEADYIYLHRLYGTGEPGRLQGALAEIFRCQNPDGSWSLYPGGPGNISLGVKCYFAAKLMGLGAADPRLTRARDWVLAHGGVVACNTFTKIYLCALGQYDYEAVPAIPPEIVLFPNWFYFNLYEISSWSRGILVPLAIAYANKPVQPLPAGQGIEELFVGGRAGADLRLPWNRRQPLSWRNFFLLIDRGLHLLERWRIRPLRRLALRRAERWLLDRLELSDGLGAIYPAMLNAIIALRCLGYAEDHPQVVRARREFERLGIDQPPTPEIPYPTFRMQPAVSPVWDTAQVVYALGQAGPMEDDPRVQRAIEWLLGKEVRHPGDWAVKVPGVEPTGWYFEFANEFYPDTDDTAQVLLALTQARDRAGRVAAVVERAIRWEFAMQCRAGGWGSFDKDCTKMIFEHIPFADHNAMLDPPTADITGRMLEMLAAYGYTLADPRVRRAADFVRAAQEPDGSWFGRWGTNYVYGTFLALRGLVAIGVPPADPQVQRGAEWVRQVQNFDGGWGETCGTYDLPETRGTGPSTPSQTAWGVLVLVEARQHETAACGRGLEWLLSRQRPDGSWDESTGSGAGRQSLYTATGFPKVFYLAYHLYRQYFPLLALAAYQRVRGAAATSSGAGN